MLLAAKIFIAKAWKSYVVDISAPNNNTSWIMLHKNLASILKDKQKGFEKAWGPWICYIPPLIKLVGTWMLKDLG